MVSVTPLRAWAAGNVTVYLKGLSVPVILNITSGETDTTTLSQEIDSRLDLRIPRQGPASPVVSIPSEKIALHDATLQAFLDGVPPDDPAIRRLKFSGNVRTPPSGNTAMIFSCAHGPCCGMNLNRRWHRLMVRGCGNCR